MRRSGIPAVLPLLLLASVSPSAVPAAEYPSRVDRVVLYPDTAEITRVADVDAGETAAVLPGLTGILLPDTLSARIDDGGGRITGVSAEDVFRSEPVDGRVAELTRLIEELSDAKREADEDAAAARREKELLDRGVLAIYSDGDGTKGGGEGSRLTASEVEAALALYRDRAESLDAKAFEKDRAARELERRIAAAKQELEAIRNPRPTREKTVRVDLDCPRQCRLEVTYRVPAAGFVPRYNARLSPEAGNLSLELVADAWQRTGEAWEGAVLTFSTARPGGMAQLPPLPPWMLDFFREPPVRPLMKMESRAADDTAASAPDAGAPGEAALPAPARRFASFEVTLDGRQSLEGGGQKKTFVLSRREQGVTVAWRAVPKVIEGAFLAAEGRNKTGLPVFAAPAALFLEDAYVGKGRLPDIPEGEEFRIDFGKDPSVAVERKELERRREDGGVFSRVKRVRFRYEISAHNFRGETVPLTVLDQVPVPRHEDIVVKDVEISGGGKRGEQGEVAWEFPLAAGEKKVLGLSFTVEYPADREIHGL